MLYVFGVWSVCPSATLSSIGVYLNLTKYSNCCTSRYTKLFSLHQTDLSRKKSGLSSRLFGFSVQAYDPMWARRLDLCVWRIQTVLLSFLFFSFSFLFFSSLFLVRFTSTEALLHSSPFALYVLSLSARSFRFRQAQSYHSKSWGNGRQHTVQPLKSPHLPHPLGPILSLEELG